MADQESNVGHILRVIASHHFGQDQVQCRRTPQLQPPGRGPRDRHELLLPFGTEKYLISAEEMGDVETLRAKLRIGGLLRIPEANIGSEFIQVFDWNDAINVLGLCTILMWLLESQFHLRPPIKH